MYPFGVASGMIKTVPGKPKPFLLLNRLSLCRVGGRQGTLIDIGDGVPCRQQSYEVDFHRRYLISSILVRVTLADTLGAFTRIHAADCSA